MPVDYSAFSAFRSNMTQAQPDFSLDPAELASLLASRLCHDLISPVGAINNAMELYEEGLGDEEALSLIRLSAAKASARLQFARLAYGTAGSAGDAVSSLEAEKLARHYLDSDKTELHWQTKMPYLPKDKAKLLLNMLVAAAGSIPRGGKIFVLIEEKQEKPLFLLHVEGSLLRLPAAFAEIYQGLIQKAAISAHNIQFYWLILLSAQTAMPLAIAQQAEFIEFLAQ
ncbi:histidine phosphotransferase family protein [Candidatus Tokpelaia sp.]|uniref:histidine phosphotransferase family protein n=1 Tax=Candidatus Tokpelaia sp. TaxID=2233777 RepID=UPI001FED5B2D|nr:histidine phosphotransferase family protein [Candidatus Tokpelaia sp.]